MKRIVRCSQRQPSLSRRDEVGTQLGQAPVIHADETPVRSNKTKAYFHVACAAMLTLLWVHINGRARTAIDAGPLPTYTGVAVHDRYIAYFSYTCGHALCNAHILRQLQSVVLTHAVKTSPRTRTRGSPEAAVPVG